jgi:hypothetical protein
MTQTNNASQPSVHNPNPGTTVALPSLQPIVYFDVEELIDAAARKAKSAVAAVTDPALHQKVGHGLATVGKAAAVVGLAVGGAVLASGGIPQKPAATKLFGLW